MHKFFVSILVVVGLALTLVAYVKVSYEIRHNFECTA